MSELKSMADAGKKSVSWREDPIILDRLKKTQALLIEGKHATDIAKELGVVYMTTRRDLARLHELWIEEAGDSIRTQRLEALAFYVDVQSKALERYSKKNETIDLRLAMDTNDRIVDLLGLAAPAKVDHSVTAVEFSASDVARILTAIREIDEESGDRDDDESGEAD